MKYCFRCKVCLSGPYGFDQALALRQTDASLSSQFRPRVLRCVSSSVIPLQFSIRGLNLMKFALG